MSEFVDLIPMVRIRMQNALLSASYPSSGSMEAVVDTGYGGFLAVPAGVFERLSLDKMKTLSRTVEVADGRRVRSSVGYATVQLVDMNLEIDGPIETFEGLTEPLVGTRFLSHFKVTFDYCLNASSFKPCS